MSGSNKEPLINYARSAFPPQKPQLVRSGPSGHSRRYGRGGLCARCGFCGKTLTGRAFAGAPPHFDSLIGNNPITLTKSRPEHPAKTPSRPRIIDQRFLKARLPLRASRPPGGFTLVEMLVVLVIVAMMMALVGTSISRNISGAEMRVAAGKVAAGLRYTRTQAILKKTEQVFLLDTEDLTFQAAERKPEKLPGGMKAELNTARSELTSETAGGIRFYPDGGSTGGNVRLEANGRVYRVNVAWLTGEASVERPDD